MKTILLLGFEFKDLIGGDIQKLHKRYGPKITFKPMYPKTREEYRKLCASPEVTAVLVQHDSLPVVPDSLALRAVPHVTFYNARGMTTEARILCQLTSIQIGLTTLFEETVPEETQAA